MPARSLTSAPGCALCRGSNSIMAQIRAPCRDAAKLVQAVVGPRPRDGCDAMRMAQSRTDRLERRNRQRQERLNGRTNERISTIMSVRRLFAALIALAVLFAPAITRVGEAYAAVPDHHTQMMTKGHCESPPDENQDKSADNSCCFQLCMAVATELSAPADRQPLLGSTETPALQSFLVGIPAELATPPPRAA